MNDQEKIISILSQGYQVLSKAMKQKPSKEGFQLVLLMLGDDGILACVQVADQGAEVVALTMAQVIQEKQTQKAARGAKLNRLMALNNACPKGYLKEGGKCKKCEKGNIFTNTQRGAFPITAYFENGGVAEDVEQPDTKDEESPIGGKFGKWAPAIGTFLSTLSNNILDLKKQRSQERMFNKYLDNLRQLGYMQFALNNLQNY